jgi:hypothetical protein
VSSEPLSVSTVHQASATRHCYTADAADAAVGSCVPQAQWRAVRCESGGHPGDAQVWVSSATDLKLQGRNDSRSQYAGRILCVDSVLLAGHGVVVCVVGTELCWQLHCALPKE